MSQPAFDFGDEPYDDPANPTFTVSELGDAINRQLRRGFPDGVWVRGEIDDLSERGPHTYFSLVEQTDEGKAVLNVQLFAPMKRNLLPLLKKHRLALSNGMKVRIFGQLDFWAAGGRLGLKMAGIDPRFTLGELAIGRDEVLRRLVASGLIDRNKRQQLPAAPLHVGVVTSLGSAAWHDFHDELARSRLGFRLTVVDSRVQGEWAVEMVAASIRTLARRGDVDAIVVIRGGGARNELATFDAEAIAVAIATSEVPVLTGLGHEVDRSVADEVAHTALKTPTACAGALVERVRDAVSVLDARWAAIGQQAQRSVNSATSRLDDRAHRIARRTHAAVERADDRLEARVQRVAACAPVALRTGDGHLARAADRLGRRPAQLLRDEERHLASIAARVTVLDPAAMLARGWSITRSTGGGLVRSVDDAPPGTMIHTQVVDGVVASRSTSPAEETDQ